MGWLNEYSHTQRPMDLGLFLRFSAVDIVADAVLSENFGLTKRGKDVQGIMKTLDLASLFLFIGHYGWASNLFVTNPFMTWLDILPLGAVFHTAMNAIEERAKSSDDDDDDDARCDVASHWLKVLREQPGRLSIKKVQAQAANTLSAGSDTVSDASQGFLYYTLRHPQVLARLRGEMQASVERGLCRTTIVSYADAQNLPYLQACIKETLRFFTPFSFNMPRVAPSGGMQIGDRVFPQGTILSINPWVIHRSKEIWGPDAGEFNPERWFKPDAVDLEKQYYIPVSSIPSPSSYTDMDD